MIVGLAAVAVALAVVACNVSPVEPSRSALGIPAEDSQTPEEVVEAFYRWYLSYPGNVLATRAYRVSEHLAPEMVERVDAMMADERGPGYDPFLLAQDLPETLTPGPATVSGDRAYLMVETSFAGHVLRVGLRREGRWLITDISQVRSPEAVVMGFYDWYLHYEGNPLADGAYKANAALTPAFVAKVERALASFDRGGFDPFLMAQDVPEFFRVERSEVGEESAIILLSSSFPGHRIRVHLVPVEGLWKIADVSLPDGS